MSIQPMAVSVTDLCHMAICLSGNSRMQDIGITFSVIVVDRVNLEFSCLAFFVTMCRQTRHFIVRNFSYIPVPHANIICIQCIEGQA